MTKQSCRDCKHLETDGMFGIFCGVGGDNTKYDCPKYAKRSDRMTENKRFVKYDGNTIVDLKLVKSWVISNGDVDLLITLLNNNRKAKKLEKREKDCSTCKYFQLDGMFGMWCDLGKDWINIKYCSDWER